MQNIHFRFHPWLKNDACLSSPLNLQMSNKTVKFMGVSPGEGGAGKLELTDALQTLQGSGVGI